jgi:hypothetical protein
LNDELDRTHDWHPVAGDFVNLPAVDTCRKCGLLRLKTLSGKFYFTQIGPPYVRCRWLAGEGKET